MSTVYLHVGQCGNQIGLELWDSVQSVIKSNEKSRHCFYTHDSAGGKAHARAVFVDGEKKVLKFLKKGKRRIQTLKFGDTNFISGCKGCGSNWAFGYNALPQDNVANEWPENLYSYQSEFDYGQEHSVLKATMETIRKEVEACSNFSGFMVIHSLGGGTGSGLGSRISTELRDRYNAAFQINSVITPHETGESPVQNYNEILTLGTLQDTSDAILMFENDVVMRQLTGGSDCKISLKEMNKLIANSILNLVSPVSTFSSKGLPCGVEPWELIRSAAPMPSLKLLSCRTEVQDAIVSGQNPWKKLSSRICAYGNQTLQSGNGLKGGSLSIVCVCRGNVEIYGIDTDVLANKLKKSFNTVKWNPFPVDIWNDFKSKKHARTSISVCANLSTLATEHCSEVVRSARKKLEANAYLHWYERHGVTRGDIDRSINTVCDVISNYKDAVNVL